MGGKTPVGEVRDALAVYAPAALLGPLTGVAPGSAIVGPRPCGIGSCPRPFVVYYEGDVYKTGELKTLADRAAQAAGRLRSEYPTVARAAVRACDVVEVGTLYEPSAATSTKSEKQAGASPRAVAQISLVRDGQGSDEQSRRLLAAWLEVEEASLDRELVGSRSVPTKAEVKADDKKAG